MADAFRNEVEARHPEIELLDHAVKDSYEEDWKHDCHRKIHQSAIFICLVGASTYQSEAVKWEIDCGLELGKHVVAVNLTGRPVRVPEILARNAIEPLPSTAASLFPRAKHAPARTANGRG